MYRYLIMFLLLILAIPLNSAERIRGHYAEEQESVTEI